MGRRDLVGIAPQAAFGTVNETMAYWLPVTSASLAASQEAMEIDETTGTRFPDGLEFGKKDAGGAIEGAARAASFGLVLASFFGEPTTTQPDAVGHPTVYQHAYDPVVNDPIALSAFLGNYDPTVAIQRIFRDLMGDALAIEVAPGDYCMFNATYLGTEVDTDVSTPGTHTHDADRKWPFHQVTLELVAAGATYASVACGKFGLKYGNGLDGDNYKLGSRARYDIDLGNADLSITALMLDAERTHFLAALEEAPADYKLRFTATGEDIDEDGTYQKELIIEVPRLQYRGAPAPVSAKDTMKGIEITLGGAYDIATSKFLTIALTNSEDGEDYVAPTVS